LTRLLVALTFWLIVVPSAFAPAALGFVAYVGLLAGQRALWYLAALGHVRVLLAAEHAPELGSPALTPVTAPRMRPTHDDEG